jgi:high-affinity Fe2+/Pb2+ permease
MREQPGGPDEPERARLARNMGELLQELRVVQTGVQILFSFLLSVAFAARFGFASQFERVTMVVTVGLTTVSAALLMAPAAWHRLYFREGRREDIIRWGNRFALAGLAFLAAAMTGAVLLVVDAVFGAAAAIPIAAGAALLFAGIWFVLPIARRARAPRDHDAAEGRAQNPG